MGKGGPSTVEELIRALGRSDVIGACGVTTSAVSNWIAAGVIPPARYLQLRALARSRGVDVPEHLFMEMAGE